jgi:hypothetical protein
MSVSGARELRQVSRDLARAGSPGRGIRSKLRKEIVKAVQPMKAQVQTNARSIAVKGTSGSTGLRDQIARATRVEVKTFGRDTRVTLKVDGKKLPAGKGKLGVYMEGSDVTPCSATARTGSRRTRTPTSLPQSHPIWPRSTAP